MYAAPPHIEPYDETLLLSQIAAGDEAAFSRLMQRYWQNIYLHILTYLKRTEVAEEITQDIFIQVWKIRQELPVLKSFESYLYIMTRNRTITELRKKRQPDDTLQTDDIMGDWLQPDGQLTYKEMYQTLMAGVAKMPPRRREVFTLSRLEGFSHNEIAEKLGISKHTVNEYIIDAMNFLRTWLRNHNDDTFLLSAIAALILYES